MSSIDKNEAIIIDVRTTGEFNEGANPLSINIPLNLIPVKINEFNKEQAIILCCASGGRSESALNFFIANGFKNVVNAGPWQNTL